MSNVFQLHPKEKSKPPSSPNVGIKIAVADLLASGDHLASAVQELSKHFDAVDRIIDTISDAETRNRHKQSMKLSRETLTRAAHELSRQIELYSERTAVDSPRCLPDSDDTMIVRKNVEPIGAGVEFIFGESIDWD